VLEPDIGFYPGYVAVLDFASLYPSIMRAHNLCFTTLVPPDKVSKFADDQVWKTPAGHTFVKKDVQEGLLPLILTKLLTARKQAKKDMKNAPDAFTRDIMNGRQLALKVSANSVYGFTGASTNPLVCVEISASVTSYGREMIL